MIQRHKITNLEILHFILTDTEKNIDQTKLLKKHKQNLMHPYGHDTDMNIENSSAKEYEK